MAEPRLGTKPLRAMQAEDWRRLRSSANYRDFLRIYVESRKISLSTLAAAAGFTRGFPGDVISGKRRLTAKSCMAFEQAMKLPSSARKLFRLLVVFEEPATFPDIAPEEVLPQIQNLRLKSWTRSRTVNESESPTIATMFRDPNLMAVYAASGQPNQGAAFAEIKSRTSLSDQEILAALETLQKISLIKKDKDCFEPQDLHVFLKSKGQSEILQTSFQRAARTAGARVKVGAGADNEMFFTSTFCVEKKQLPQLKKALRETILRFVDDSIQSDGDKVVHLLTALHL